MCALSIVTLVGMLMAVCIVGPIGAVLSPLFDSYDEYKSCLMHQVCVEHVRKFCPAKVPLHEY